LMRAGLSDLVGNLEKFEVFIEVSSHTHVAKQR